MNVNASNAQESAQLSASATGAATTSKASFSADFETFLTLLTTQLTQQDPLSPMDSDKFTQQLVQYSQVEQSIKTNSNLEKMLEGMQADRLTSALDYVGQWVEINGNQVNLRDQGDATLNYTMPEGAISASVTILDAQSQTVARLEVDAAAGERKLSWDGIGSDGSRQPSGRYFMRVEAVDANDQPLTVTSRVGGLVDGVEREGEQIALIVDGQAHSLSSVRSVSRPLIN